MLHVYKLEENIFSKLKSGKVNSIVKPFDDVRIHVKIDHFIEFYSSGNIIKKQVKLICIFSDLDQISNMVSQDLLEDYKIIYKSCSTNLVLFKF